MWLLRMVKPKNEQKFSKTSEKNSSFIAKKIVILKNESYSIANKIFSVSNYQTPNDVFWPLCMERRE